MTETVMQLDILAEVHEVRRKIFEMRLKEREELMRNADEIARLLNQGSIKGARKKMKQIATK